MSALKNLEHLKIPLRATELAHGFMNHLSRFARLGGFGNTVFICMFAEIDEKNRKGKIRVVEHGVDSMKANVLKTYLDFKLKEAPL